MKKVFLLVLCIAAVTGIMGCKNKETVSPPSRPGKVIATAAYETYFGTVPQVDKGTAYAFVIFFPSSKVPGKVVPFPFFTFDEGTIKKVAIERLLGGMDVGSYHGEFIPFPSGTRLVTLKEDHGTITATFSKELEKSPEAATAHALALTLRQFKGVKAVRALVEGKESLLSTLIDKTDEGTVLQPSPPRLLSITATRDKGAKNIDEVNAFFDRPVDIKELKLFTSTGQPFAGEIYHSVFDMAAVLKPEAPEQFKAGMPVKVLWKVIDKRGRQAEGDSIRSLDIKER